MTFSWTYLINVTLLDTATTNGCINNSLITFTDSPARNSNSSSALPCMPKTLRPNIQHCAWSIGGVDACGVVRVCYAKLSAPGGCRPYSPPHATSACTAPRLCTQFVCECQIILAEDLGQDSGSERETFVSNQRKWRAVDLHRISLNLYLFETRRGQPN